MKPISINPDKLKIVYFFESGVTGVNRSPTNSLVIFPEIAKACDQYLIYERKWDPHWLLQIKTIHLYLSKASLTTSLKWKEYKLIPNKKIIEELLNKDKSPESLNIIPVVLNEDDQVTFKHDLLFLNQYS